MTENTRTEVLDHGYLKLIESWGSDEGIIEAARMSTAKGFKGWETASAITALPGHSELRRTPLSVEEIAEWQALGRPSKWQGAHYYRNIEHRQGDEKLLRYLWENKHATPFEMAGLTVEVQAPIFVFRQWHRHRTQSYNEMSARYTAIPPLDYMPSIERLLVNSETNKQAGTAKGARTLDRTMALIYQDQWRQTYAKQEKLYKDALRDGVPKELARIHLPVARYSRMRASANLRNWLGFLTLRLDPHAQYEIRVYAEAIGKCIEQAYPRTWELFAEGLKA